MSAVATRPAYATPSALFSVGTESQALGKTGVAGVNDLGAVILNPAALSTVPERCVWLGYSAASFTPEVEGGPEPAQPAYTGTSVGVRLPIAPHALPVDLTLGLALTSPRDVIVRAMLPLPETPQFPLLSTRAHALDLALALGARLSGRWSVGLGLRALSGLAGEVEVPGETAGGVATELSLDLAPVAGVLFHPSPQDAFGLVYRGALSAPFTVALRNPSLSSISLPPLHLDGTAHYDPAEVGLEWTRWLGGTRVALGVVYQRWSAFPGWLGRTVRCPDGDPSCDALPAETSSLSDTLSPRLGAAHVIDLDPVELTLRAGYAYEPTPLPEQTGAANRWDSARSVLTAGYAALLLDTPLTLSAAYQLHVLHARSHRKDDPDDAAFQQVRVSGTVQHFGLMVEVRY